MKQKFIYIIEEYLNERNYKSISQCDYRGPVSFHLNKEDAIRGIPTGYNSVKNNIYYFNGFVYHIRRVKTNASKISSSRCLHCNKTFPYQVLNACDSCFDDYYYKLKSKDVHKELRHLLDKYFFYEFGEVCIRTPHRLDKDIQESLLNYSSHDFLKLKKVNVDLLIDMINDKANVNFDYSNFELTDKEQIKLAPYIDTIYHFISNEEAQDIVNKNIKIKDVLF